MYLKKFSKTLKDIFSIKSDFLSENQRLLDQSLNINKKYNDQEIRKRCKICATKLETNADIRNHGVGYVICRNCNHLNGQKEDTYEFTMELYAEDSGANYSRNYLTEYKARIDNIYTPKIQFLIDSLRVIGISKESISLNDYGCGGGHLVNAGEAKGISCTGFDISKDLIELAIKYKNDAISVEHSNALNFFR